MFFSGYVEEQLLPGFGILMTWLSGAHIDMEDTKLNQIYIRRKYLRVSQFAVQWAKSFVGGEHMIESGMLSKGYCGIMW